MLDRNNSSDSVFIFFIFTKLRHVFAFFQEQEVEVDISSTQLSLDDLQNFINSIQKDNLLLIQTGNYNVKGICR